MATINSGSGAVYGHPTTFRANDPPRAIEAKILNALGSGGGTSAGIVASGVGNPNSLGLGANVQVFNEFDGANNFVRQWEKNPVGTFV